MSRSPQAGDDSVGAAIRGHCPDREDTFGTA